MNLELGGGESPLEGYVNMDAFYKKGVDIVHDATLPWEIESNSVENIYSCEFMEHISYDKIDFVLSESYRVLSPGGRFYFSCPDFEEIVNKIFSCNDKDKIVYMKRGILGDGVQPFDFHRNVLWYEYAKKILEEAGFKNVKRYSYENELKLCMEGYKL